LYHQSEKFCNEQAIDEEFLRSAEDRVVLIFQWFCLPAAIMFRQAVLSFTFVNGFFRPQREQVHFLFIA